MRDADLVARFGIVPSRRGSFQKWIASFEKRGERCAISGAPLSAPYLQVGSSRLNFTAARSNPQRLLQILGETPENA